MENNQSSTQPYIIKLAGHHRLWWLSLIIATLIVSVITSHRVTIGGLISSMLGHLTFAVVVAVIPWLVYRLAGNPLTTEQMMATITVGWLILAVANLSV